MKSNNKGSSFSERDLPGELNIISNRFKDLDVGCELKVGINDEHDEYMCLEKFVTPIKHDCKSIDDVIVEALRYTEIGAGLSG